MSITGQMLDDADDQIAKLREERDAARAECERLNGALDSVRADHERLERETMRLHNAMGEGSCLHIASIPGSAALLIERLRAECERVREVLPIARLAVRHCWFSDEPEAISASLVVDRACALVGKGGG